MFKIGKKLAQLTSQGKRLEVAIYGAGKMGNGLINQLSRIDGIRPSVVVNRTPAKARKALLKAGVLGEKILETDDLKRAQAWLDQGGFVIGRKKELGYGLAGIEAIVDATGDPEYGALIAYGAIENKKHIIMLNVECDSVVGPILYQMAKEANLVYTGTKGDEPGAIIELAEFAQATGFDLLAVGKGKNNKLDRYATEDSLAEEAGKKGLNPRMLTSFVDGTNTMIELTSVANALGFLPDVDGCHGIETNPKRAAKDFSLKSQGGVLDKYGVVDYAFGMAPGVFALVTTDQKEVADLMNYLSMGEGPNYIIYRPYHLTSLETPITIYQALVEKEASIAPYKGQVADTISYAKRDLKKGDLLDGIGSKDLYGLITSHEKQKQNNYLPIGLVGKNTYLKVDVKKDQPLTYDMVELDEGSILTRLRRRQEEMGL